MSSSAKGIEAWLLDVASIIAELDTASAPAPTLQRVRKRKSKLRPLWEE